MGKAGGAKRRLTPMELKQQQRQQREQRKRAKLSQSQSSSAGENGGTNPPSSEDHAGNTTDSACSTRSPPDPLPSAPLMSSFSHYDPGDEFFSGGLGGMR